MTFSIIIAVYNVEQYIEKCLQSILEQTYGEYEVILVNDGSTDNSGEICDRYAKEYQNIQVIHKENGGASSARNEGLAVAKGEYVLFLDSDDYIKSDDFLETLEQKAVSMPDVIIYKFEKYYEKTDTYEPCRFQIPENIGALPMGEALDQLVERDAFYCAAWTKAVKRQLLQEKEIQFEEGIIGEDQDWYYQVLLHVKKMEGIDESFIVYRQRENSVTSSWKIKNLTDCIYILKKWKNGLEHADIESTVREALFHSLAKLYCNLLIAYACFDDKNKKQYFSELKELSGLLAYKQNQRVRIVAKVKRLIGLKGAIIALKTLNDINELRRH